VLSFCHAVLQAERHEFFPFKGRGGFIEINGLASKITSFIMTDLKIFDAGVSAGYVIWIK